MLLARALRSRQPKRGDQAGAIRADGGACADLMIAPSSVSVAAALAAIRTACASAGKNQFPYHPQHFLRALHSSRTTRSTFSADPLHLPSPLQPSPPSHSHVLPTQHLHLPPLHGGTASQTAEKAKQRK